jgi:predicted CXXCH cytochrome family protein
MLFLSPPANAENSRREIPLHHFQLACDYCHQLSSADTGQPTSDGKTFQHIKPDALWQCTLSGCHNFNAVLDHPVGIRFRGAAADGVPLGAQSRITCVTCHYKKEAAPDTTDANTVREPYLHSPEGIEFCAKCHTRMPGSILEQSHWQFSTRAHLGSISPHAGPAEAPQASFGGIDKESRMCLSCHENVGVTVTALSETPRQKTVRLQTMSDHPIGMDYRHTARHEQGRFNFPLTDQEIRLFDGNVGCGSCHSPYSRLKNDLVMSNLKSALCLKCHDM